MKKTGDNNPVPAAGLVRRLLAMVYDSLLLAAIFLLAALPVVLIVGGSMPGTALRFAFQVYLMTIAFIFFGWFWIHGGQTLGMRAWRLRVVDLQGETISWGAALKRFLAAILSMLVLGLGYLWILVDSQGRAWHDLLSKTRVIVLPGKKAPG